MLHPDLGRPLDQVDVSQPMGTALASSFKFSILATTQAFLHFGTYLHASIRKHGESGYVCDWQREEATGGEHTSIARVVFPH